MIVVVRERLGSEFRMKRKIALDNENSYWSKWKDHSFVRVALFILLAVALFVLLMDNVAPDVVDVSINRRATDDILAPLSMIDEHATQRARDEAEDAIQPVYTQDDTITNNQI